MRQMKPRAWTAPGSQADDLSGRVARLEERMNTMKAENQAGFEKLSKELARRDRTMLLAIPAMIGFAVALLKFG